MKLTSDSKKERVIHQKPARNEIRFSLNGIILLRSENALHLEGFLLGSFLVQEPIVKKAAQEPIN